MEHEGIRVSSPAEIDALVGQHVTGERPEVFWEDSHGQFQFDSETEARRALQDPYYQRFLPAVDWTVTTVREVLAYRPYCADPAFIWMVVDRASARFGPLLLWREQSRWLASFGPHPAADARTALVAICVAALRGCGLSLEVNHDRIDSEIAQYLIRMQQTALTDGHSP